MGYTPDNNPYIPGDPYSYDLKWQVDNIKHMQTRFAELDEQVQEATDQADRAEQEADRAAGRADFATEEADRATEEADRAAGRADFATEEADRATEEADRAESEADRSKNYADHIADPVAGLVASWLADNVDPDTGYVIDKTLTIENAAADAFITGDVLSKKADALINLFNKNTATTGQYISANVITADPNSYTTDFIPVSVGKYITSISVSGVACAYLSDMTYSRDLVISNGVFTVSGNVAYVKLSGNVRNLSIDVLYAGNTLYEYIPHDSNGYNYLYNEIFALKKIMGGIQATNAIMSTDGSQSYIGSDANYRVTTYNTGANRKCRYICKAKGQGAALICFYDDADTFLGYRQAMTSGNLNSFDIVFTTPPACSYIKVSAYYPDDGILYVIGETNRFKFAGKLFACIGDSRTWYDNRPYDAATDYEGIICRGYQSYLRDLGAKTLTYGYSGLTTPQIEDRSITYDFPTKADYFIIWSGVNDWQKNVQLGSLSAIGSSFDDTTTAGAYQKMIEFIINNNNDARIYIMGNYKSWNLAQGSTEPEAMTELFIDMCKLYALPFLDLMHESRINILNRQEFFADSAASNLLLHLSNAGYEFISNLITSFIDNN